MTAKFLKTRGLRSLGLVVLLLFGATCLLLGWYKLEPRVLRPFAGLSGREWAKEIEAAVSRANQADPARRALAVRCVPGDRAELSLEHEGKEGRTLVVKYLGGDATWLPRVDRIYRASGKDSFHLHLVLPRLRSGYHWYWENPDVTDRGTVSGGISRDGQGAEGPCDVELGSVVPHEVWLDEEAFAAKFRENYQGKSASEIRKMIRPGLPLLPSTKQVALENNEDHDPWGLFHKARILPVLGMEAGATYAVRLRRFRSRCFGRVWTGDVPGPGLFVNSSGRSLTKYRLYPSRNEWAAEAGQFDPAGPLPGISWAHLKGELSKPPSTFAAISTARLHLYGRLLATPSESLGDLFQELDQDGGATAELISLLDRHSARDHYATYEYCYATLCLLDLWEKYPDKARPGAQALAAALRSAASRLAAAVRADGSVHKLDGKEPGSRSLAFEVFSVLYSLLRAQDQAHGIAVLDMPLRRDRIGPAMKRLTDCLVKGTEPPIRVRYIDTTDPSPQLDAAVAQAIIDYDLDTDLESIDREVTEPEPNYLFWYRLLQVVQQAEWLDDIELDPDQKLPQGLRAKLEGFVFGVFSADREELQEQLAAATTCGPRAGAVFDAGALLRPRFARVALHRMIRLIDRRGARGDRPAPVLKAIGD